MNELNIDYIVNEVNKRLKHELNNEDGIFTEASGRHVHLSREHVELLFGKGYKLTKKRDLSQPGQYLCEEKINLIGPKKVIYDISVLGPERENTQIELSKTDAVSIGLKTPVRMSGSISNSSPAIISTPLAAVKINEGVIVAKRHIHMTPEDAVKYGVKNNDEVNVKIEGERGVIFTNVAVRVSRDFKTTFHIDYDEANACGFVNGMRGHIIK